MSIKYLKQEKIKLDGSVKYYEAQQARLVLSVLDRY